MKYQITSNEKSFEQKRIDDEDKEKNNKRDANDFKYHFLIPFKQIYPGQLLRTQLQL